MKWRRNQRASAWRRNESYRGVMAKSGISSIVIENIVIGGMASMAKAENGEIMAA